MGYKRIGKVISFADLAVSKSLEHNRSLTMMNKINMLISWKNIEALLLEYYDVGRSTEGADAYPPLMLLKCLLLQKWFHIPSDPELENQIDDRISFKKFLNLPLDKPSPDHSTFSRFRSRLSKEAMMKLNNEVLQGFEKMGLSINEGKVDKNGNPLKFSRDLESDWTIKNDKPHYGLKEHASVDVHSGFVLATTLTPVSEHDSKYLPI